MSPAHEVRSTFLVYDDEQFRFAYRFVVNDSLHPFPRADGPSDATSSVPASSSDSSDSYNSDDAWRYLHEWRMAQNCYSEVTWENDQLEIRLGVS